MHVIKPGLAVLMVLAISCKKDNLLKSSSAPVQANTERAPGIYLGKHYQGGVIFYIDTTGRHGLIADTADLGQFMWWNGTNVVTGAKKTVIGSGSGNTSKIISVQGIGKYAARICSKSTNGGYTDWFLPSKDELNEMFKQQKMIGRFAKGYYWSSSEVNGNLAWFQSFADGTQPSNGKHYVYYVRAVRMF